MSGAMLFGCEPKLAHRRGGLAVCGATRSPRCTQTAASTATTTASKTIIRIGDLAGAGGMSDRGAGTLNRLKRLPNPSQHP